MNTVDLQTDGWACELVDLERLGGGYAVSHGLYDYLDRSGRVVTYKVFMNHTDALNAIELHASCIHTAS